MMQSKLTNASSGFSLIEMLIAMSVGLLVLGGAVSMYTQGVQATWAVSQRAQMQQDSRAAYDLITQDIGLAGAGLPTGGLALTSGGTAPKFGCDVVSGLCHLGSNNNASVAYPLQSGSPTINYMYWVIPGCTAGPAINTTIGRTDAITVVYSDNTLLLPDYAIEFMDVNGNNVNFIYPSTVPTPAPQQVNNTGVGLQLGDLVLFQNGTNYAVSEITTPPGTAAVSPYAVAFASGDLLNFNQNSATSNGLKQLIAACVAGTACTVGTAPTGTNVTAVTATRIWAVTYYLDNSSGIATLMRQVNGRQPVPVADNVENLQFTYDGYNSNGNLVTATCNAGGSSDYNLIRTINLGHLSFRSQLKGTKGYQGTDMQTSISARNLSFSARYGSN
jgi:prepilin-type N-terminal cleavage/methylation domain-containing protein